MSVENWHFDTFDGEQNHHFVENKNPQLIKFRPRFSRDLLHVVLIIKPMF